MAYFRHLAKWILRNTVVCNDHLTPEISLHLITPQCPQWMMRPDHCPFPDPYWAFYWPGGQAVAKYLIENGNLVKDMTVLDFGCGCGAGSIAASICEARKVIANDIDLNALGSTYINCRLNKQTIQSRVQFLPDNLLSRQLPMPIDIVLVGDMFYDDAFGSVLLKWLEKCLETNEKLLILVGDPGRHPLQSIGANFRTLATYALPAYTKLSDALHQNQHAKLHDLELATKWRHSLRSEKLNEFRWEAALTIKHAKEMLNKKLQTQDSISTVLQETLTSSENNEQLQYNRFTDMYETESGTLTDSTFKKWDEIVEYTQTQCHYQYEIFSKDFAHIQSQKATIREIWNAENGLLKEQIEKDYNGLSQKQTRQQKETVDAFESEITLYEHHLNHLAKNYQRIISDKRTKVQLNCDSNQAFAETTFNQLAQLKLETLCERGTNTNDLKELALEVDQLSKHHCLLSNELDSQKTYWHKAINKLCQTQQSNMEKKQKLVKLVKYALKDQLRFELL